MLGAKKFIHGHKTYILLILISIFPVMALYMPFILKLNSFWGIPFGNTGLQVIFANWDGPNYVYNAITNYEPQKIASMPFLNVPEYYPAHFPGLSWIISIFALFFGFYTSSFIVQILSGILLNFVFYNFIKTKSQHPLWLTFAFTVFPPRYLILRAILGPELLLTAIVILCFAFWEKKKYITLGIFSFLAMLLKFQALTIPATFGIIAVIDSIKHKKPNLKMYASVILGLSGYLIVATFYSTLTGNFNAYFEAQKLVGMAAQLPFMMFNYSQKWVGTGWMEAPAIYFIGMIAVIVRLFHIKKFASATFVVVYTVMLSLIPQVDIMRLAFPISPFLFYAYSDELSGRTARLTLILSLPIIYLFAINFIITNQAPITDWSLFK